MKNEQHYRRSRASAVLLLVSEYVAPIFPYQYGHSRRIACDAQQSLIGNTAYTTNALGFFVVVTNSYGALTSSIADPAILILTERRLAAGFGRGNCGSRLHFRTFKPIANRRSAAKMRIAVRESRPGGTGLFHKASSSRLR